MKYRCDVAGMRENNWSNNAMEYDTIEEAQAWLKGLAGRWFGYNISRVVTVDTPIGEVVDREDSRIYQDYRG